MIQIPLTSEQRDIGMLPDLSATIPLRIDSMISGGEKLVVFDERPSFKNNMVRPPKINSIDVPEVYKEAGPQWDQKLLNPAQRREIFEFEKKRLEAKAFIHDAVGAREKTRKQLEGMNFKRGVLMVDSNLNEDSEIFGQVSDIILYNLSHASLICTVLCYISYRELERNVKSESSEHM